MKTKLLYLGLLIILSAILYLYFHPSHIHQKCPDDYANTDAGSAEQLADIDKWTNNFYDTHPGATLSDWGKARYQFWVDNNCTAAIQRYEAAKNGTANPATMGRIRAGIQQATETLQYVSDLGFSFNYPKDMYVMTDPNSPQIIILPNSYKTNKNQAVTAVVISSTLNEPPMTPLEWLKGPNSGADMSKGYSKVNIDGQEAISTNRGAWITVNTPDNKRQMSIATLPSVNPSKSLVAEMASIVHSIVFSK